MVTIRLNQYQATTESGAPIELGTRDSYGIEQLKIERGDGWDSLVVTATFSASGKALASPILVPEDGVISVPSGATSRVLRQYDPGVIVFRGVADGVQRISSNLYYTVGNHGPVEGIAPHPTPSEWEQFVAQVQESADSAVQSATQAEQAAEQSAQNAALAEESADQAKQIATDAAAELEKVQSAGNQAVQDIGNASQTALEGIDSAKDGALTSISTEGNQALTAISQAQSTGVQAVQNAQTEAEQSIRALVPDVYTKTESNARYAPAQSAVMVSGKGDGLANLKNTAPWYMQGLSLYGKTTQDGTPSPENPVPLVSTGDSGSVDVTVAGANLLPFPYNVGSQVINGVTFTINSDGSIAINGTATASASLRLQDANTKWNLGKAFLSGNSISNDRNKFRLAFAKTPEYTLLIDEGAGVQLDLTNTTGFFYIDVRAGFTVENKTIYPMLNVGTTSQPWQPYQSQSLPIPTPNGLPGIPVDSGGNWVDENGQQWVSDVVDLAAGTKTQNVVVVNAREFNWTTRWNALWPVDGTLVINDDGVRKFSIKEVGFCTILNPARIRNGLIGFSTAEGGGSLGIRVPTSFVNSLEAWKSYIEQHDVVFVLGSTIPITTPLDAETISAYKALQSYQGQTNILAAGCGIQAIAVGDGTAIITGLANKIAALESAQTRI